MGTETRARSEIRYRFAAPFYYHSLLCFTKFYYSGSLEDALSASKYYSDYFSTTEAENQIEEDAAPAPKKVLRKKKTNTAKAMDKSDSEDDNRGGTSHLHLTSFM